MSGLSLSEMRDALREAQAHVAAVAAQLADEADVRRYWRVVDRWFVVYDNVGTLETALVFYTSVAKTSTDVRIVEVTEREMRL